MKAVDAIFTVINIIDEWLTKPRSDFLDILTELAMLIGIPILLVLVSSWLICSVILVSTGYIINDPMQDIATWAEKEGFYVILVDSRLWISDKSIPLLYKLSQ